MAIDSENRVEVVLPDDTIIGTITDAVTVSKSGTAILASSPVSAGTIYTAGDNLGGLLTFTNAAKVVGGGGKIMGVIITDDAGQDADTELWLFDRTFTAGVDNAPWSPVEVELHNLVAIISTKESSQGWIDAGTPSVCDIEVARRFNCIGTSLFGRLVTRGTPTEVAIDDIRVRLMLSQD